MRWAVVLAAMGVGVVGSGCDETARAMPRPRLVLEDVLLLERSVGDGEVIRDASAYLVGAPDGRRCIVIAPGGLADPTMRCWEAEPE